MRLAARALERVDRLPARIHDHLGSAAREEVVDGAGVARGGASSTGILEHVLDGLRRVLLVRADDARRPALDPSRAVEAGYRRAALVQDAAVGVRDRSRALVERHSRDPDPAVPDAAKDETAGKRLALLGGDGPNRTALVRLEAVAHDLHTLDALLSEDRDRRRAETEPDRPRLPRRLPCGEVAKDLEVAMDDVGRGLELR